MIKTAPIVIFDANIPLDGMEAILELCKKHDKPGLKTIILFLN